jgi:hypothetical protein
VALGSVNAPLRLLPAVPIFKRLQMSCRVNIALPLAVGAASATKSAFG